MKNKTAGYKSLTTLRLLLKTFIVERGHNGTALLIFEMMTRCDRRHPVGRRLQNFLRRYLNRRYGCFISPDARIGDRCLFPHPVGIVIGDGVIIGEDCVIYQNVTLGARARGAAGERYPELGDRAVIYAGAVVVGAVRIGKGAVVAANAVVTIDVEDGAVAAGVPAVVRRPADRREPGLAADPAPSTAA